MINDICVNIVPASLLSDKMLINELRNLKKINQFIIQYANNFGEYNVLINQSYSCKTFVNGGGTNKHFFVNKYIFIINRYNECLSELQSRDITHKIQTWSFWSRNKYKRKVPSFCYNKYIPTPYEMRSNAFSLQCKVKTNYVYVNGIKVKSESFIENLHTCYEYELENN